MMLQLIANQLKENFLQRKNLTESGEFNNKLRYIDIKFHFNRKIILKKKKDKLEHIKIENMLADPLAKDFNGPKMAAFTEQIFDKKEFWFEGKCYYIN